MTYSTEDVAQTIEHAWFIHDLVHDEMHLSGRVNDYSLDDLKWMHDTMNACLCHIKHMSELIGDFNPFGGKLQ